MGGLRSMYQCMHSYSWGGACLFMFLNLELLFNYYLHSVGSVIGVGRKSFSTKYFKILKIFVFCVGMKLKPFEVFHEKSERE